MITSRKELAFVIKADRMMNKGQFTRSLKDCLIEIVCPDYVMQYLRLLRKEEFYSSQGKRLAPFRIWNQLRFRKLGAFLGFSIAANVFSYGLVIPHHGTIVVGSGNKIGKYCVLHTSTCITAGKKQIGDAFYLSTGAKVIKDISLGNAVSVSANSIVNKTFTKSDCVLAGMPASIVKHSEAWYLQNDTNYYERVQKCESYRQQLGL